MIKTITISEYGSIHKQTDYEDYSNTFTEIYVSDTTFIALKKIVFASKIDNLFSYTIRKGKEQIAVRNYVGLIQFSSNEMLEILPKSLSGSVKDARKVLLKLLQKLPQSPYQQFSNAYLSIAHLSLFEIFVSIFLDELEILIKQGVGKDFETEEGNELYVKGKVLWNENIRKNNVNKQFFYLKFDVHKTDIAANRILKKCLYLFGNKDFTNKIKNKINQFSSVFNEISDTENMEADWQIISKNNLIFQRYEKLLSWARIFLNEQSFLPFSGHSNQLSILFPMEILFENYVGKMFQKYFKEIFEVRLQTREKYLIINHLGKAKFRLIPDIILSNAEQNIVIDTKWKLINSTKSKHNYQIEQSDLYQLYAYGKKYEAKQLFLIYPANENFQEPLEIFDYDAQMKLKIIPFNLNNAIEEEMLKIRKLLL